MEKEVQALADDLVAQLLSRYDEPGLGGLRKQQQAMVNPNKLAVRFVTMMSP